ncbi:MAG: HD domain-containing protein [Clostridiales bacterium]|jgi:putative hydrolase of HD superfamily|nr:HD domain-containing protein [Clostridiales bacterium]
MDKDRLRKQIDFIVEVDKLKNIYRQTLLMDGSRNENDAEHSWHLALMAMVLKEYSPQKDLDISKVLKMLLVHDLVEIYAGDTFCYDVKGNLDKASRELAAADKLYSILPPDQGKEMRALWDEFEERKTPEALFASSLDRLQPLICNYLTEGHTWVKYGIKSSKVMERTLPIQEGAPGLWDLVEEMMEDSIEQGILERD